MITKHPSGNYCTEDHVVAYSIERGNKLRQKADKKAAKEKGKADRAQHRADKERIKPRKWWYDKLQALVNQYVVHVRDKDKPCCTCNTGSADIKYDAGHCFTRKAMPELRFELTNIHIQCSVECNQHGSGMRLEYREFIIRRYGQERLDWLEGPHKSLKEQFPEYTDIKSEILRYRKILRDNGLTPNA